MNADQSAEKAQPENAPVIQPNEAQPDELVDLSSGKGFQLGDADYVTMRSITRVVLIAGTAESGKTSLLASLFLMFQRGHVGNYLFAGSDTLVGFEERAHNARIASRLDQPKTERTKISQLLHLRVREEEHEGCRDLLLCDLSGEDFREARDSTEGCRRLVAIRRADCFALLVDGRKLSRLETRQQAKNDPIALLSSW